MSAKNHVCEHCGRAFSMPGHLGRHLKAIHGVHMGSSRAGAKKKPSAPSRTSMKTNGALAPMPGLASGQSMDELLASMRSYQAQLTARRQEIDHQIASIDAAIRTMGGPTGAKLKAAPVAGAPSVSPLPAGSKTAGVRPGSLKDYIVRVLKNSGRILTIKEIVDEVQRAGYQTKSQNLTNAVNNALAQLDGVVKKVGRGQYTI